MVFVEWILFLLFDTSCGTNEQAVEVQLGLGKLAARTQQLQAAEVSSLIQSFVAAVIGFGLSVFVTDVVWVGYPILTSQRSKELAFPLQVYTAVEQAVLHAPHRAEAHNLRGLVCESRGDNGASIKSFLLARYALSLASSATSASFREESLAVSLNLARVLCKVGNTGLFRTPGLIFLHILAHCR
jgi:hypothetical protein